MSSEKTNDICVPSKTTKCLQNKSKRNNKRIFWAFLLYDYTKNVPFKTQPQSHTNGGGWVSDAPAQPVTWPREPIGFRELAYKVFNEADAIYMHIPLSLSSPPAFVRVGHSSCHTSSFAHKRTKTFAALNSYSRITLLRLMHSLKSVQP
jgi:hypothetical protein